MRFPASGGVVKAVGAKLLVQQLVLNPFFYLPGFYVSTGLLLGHGAEAIKTKIESEYTETLMYLWAIWVPTTAVVSSFALD
jgi:hypothetical protein